MNDMSDEGGGASPSDILSGGSMLDGGGAVTGTDTPQSNESAACPEEPAHAPAGSEQQLRAEIKRRDQAIIGLRRQIIAARMDAARLRRDLEVVYSSRSWRLTRAYRAIGQAMTALATGMQRRRDIDGGLPYTGQSTGTCAARPGTVGSGSKTCRRRARCARSPLRKFVGAV